MICQIHSIYSENDPNAIYEPSLLIFLNSVLMSLHPIVWTLDSLKVMRMMSLEQGLLEVLTAIANFWKLILF